MIGGAGYFGHLLVEDLRQHADAEVVVPDRSLRLAAVAPALEGVQIAICAAGPYQGLPLTLPMLCLERGIHYIDLTDDRSYLGRVQALVRARPDSAALPAVCSGWSAVPALSALLAKIAIEDLHSVERLDIQIAPGNRAPRGRGTVLSLLDSIGRSFAIWDGGAWRTVRGGTEPRVFQFPLPVGARTGYLVDVPDHEIFPGLFQARAVAFRVGAEIPVLNLGISLMARLPCRDWTPWASALRRTVALLGFLGHDWGAVGVEARGPEGGRRASVVAERGGPRIPVMPAAVMAAMLASGEADFHGTPPLDRWITRERLGSECERRGFRLLVEEIPRG